MKNYDYFSYDTKKHMIQKNMKQLLDEKGQKSFRWKR